MHRVVLLNGPQRILLEPGRFAARPIVLREIRTESLRDSRIIHKLTTEALAKQPGTLRHSDFAGACVQRWGPTAAEKPQ
jgi:hypothetical protein